VPAQNGSGSGSGCSFWIFLIGEFIWHLFDFTIDTLFYTESIQGSLFHASVSKQTHQTVQRVALVLLVVNGLMLVCSQVYLVRVKIAIRRLHRAQDKLTALLPHAAKFLTSVSDPTFVMQISQVHFFLMLLSFLLEDAPGLCLFAIVQQSTGDFSDVQKAQLGTSLVGSAVFIFLAYRKYVGCQRAAQAWSWWAKLLAPVLLVAVVAVVVLVESGGSHSQPYTPAELAAWQDLYDSTNGPKWSSCSDARSDPCSCSWGDGQGYGVGCAGGHITEM
jgi:hypothetical protein